MISYYTLFNEVGTTFPDRVSRLCANLHLSHASPMYPHVDGG